jgi:magnesium transporter
MSEPRFFHISTSGKMSRLATLAEALAAAGGGGYLWLDYCQPKADELSALIAPFGLHPLAIEDCTDDVNQVPKVEDYPRHTFLIFNVFDYAQKKLSIGEVDMFVGENVLVTVSGRGPDQRPLLEGIDRAVERDMDNVRQGPSFLMHVLLDRVVDHKFAAIETLEEELNLAEEAMIADLAGFQPAELFRLRRDLLMLRKALFHEREILVKLCRKDSPYIADAAIFHYRDIYDHLTKFFELTETDREIVTSLMEMHLSMINNRMSRIANETNMRVRRLTLVTTILMPLTLLAGIGGMSEWSMMTGAGPENWPIPYAVFIAGMAAIGGVTYCLLKWIEKKSPESPA